MGRQETLEEVSKDGNSREEVPRGYFCGKQCGCVCVEEGVVC